MVTCRNNRRRDKIKGDRTGTSRRNLAPERSLIARLLSLSQSPTSPDALSLHATPPTRDIPRCQSVSRTDRHVTLAARPCIAVASAVSPLATHCARSSTGWSAVRDPRRATGDPLFYCPLIRDLLFAVRNARHAMRLFRLFRVPLRDIACFKLFCYSTEVCK